MGRYTGPACRLCRREGMKLFLKGDRCRMAKCPIETGRPAPGMHGARPSKKTDYCVQLREKQRLRRSYGLREGQFKLFFERAASKRGVTGEMLLQLLEMRLDNLAYRLGFGASRRAARQLVLHGHFTVNGRRADVPSMTLKVGDKIEVKGRKQSQEAVKRVVDAKGREAASWLTLDKDALKGEVIRIPTREEIAPLVNEQLIVELYSK
ncbi:MAG: 30S ribosomal protein S4 [bacterium]|jgi:small subunit ribosomal protein S4